MLTCCPFALRLYKIDRFTYFLVLPTVKKIFNRFNLIYITLPSTLIAYDLVLCIVGNILTRHQQRP